MAFDFDKFKSDVANAGAEIGAKAKEVTETAKLKIDVKSKENELDKLYMALGRVYYTKHQDDAEVPEDVMFRGIRKAEEELAALKEELSQK